MDNNLGQVVLVKDINPDTSYYSPNTDSYPRSLTEFDDKLYFSATDGENGRELWVSDGTAEGTQLVADIAPGIGNYGNANGSFPQELIEFNDKLYFSADDGETGSELWVSDGTAEGTQLLIEINPAERNAGTPFAFPAGSDPSNFIEFNHKLYFSAIDGVVGDELWVSDGTAEGTQLLVDIKPETDDNISPYSSNPRSFAELNDRLYFAADDGVVGGELWVSDGTAEGTQLLVDISPDVNRSYQYDYLNGSNPIDLFEFKDKIYFSANDDESGREIWVSDGTEEGTQLLVDINPGSNSYRYGFGGNYYYADYPARSNPSDFVEFQDKLYFSARNNETGRELWVTDGTAEGTQLVADINPGTEGSAPIELVEFNDKLYFSAEDGENGRELWVSDGTSEGTQLVADINPENDNYNYGYSFSDIGDLTVVGNELFFSADNGETGKELFKLVVDDLDGEMPIAIDGTDGSDNLFGSDNAEQIDGFGGQDRLDGGGGNDTIDGGNGDDILLGDRGDDLLMGKSGNDRLRGGKGNDTLDGGEGNDRLTGQGGDDSLLGGNGNDSLSGRKNNDTLNGGNGDDILLGDRGDDLLMGKSGDDRLRGGKGNDTLDGGVGHDSLKGGRGHDIFVLRAGDGTDTIANFELGGDRLGLANGLQFDRLSFCDDKILAGEEVLASLNGIDTEHLTPHDFTEIQINFPIN